MKEFPKKFYKVLNPEFTDAVQAMTKEEIQSKILQAEENIYMIDAAMSDDEELLKAKEHLKELGISYKEGKLKENSIIKYCLWVLEERGTELGTKG